MCVRHWDLQEEGDEEDFEDDLEEEEEEEEEENNDYENQEPTAWECLSGATWEERSGMGKG